MDQKLLPVNDQLELLLNGDAHSQPCDSCQSLDLEINLPSWFDKEKYKRGQKYIWRNIFAQFGVTLCGLIGVLAIPSILNLLMATKKSSNKISAYRRYLSTLKHVYSWYSDDLKPGTTAWKSLMAVRSRHLRASKTSQRKGGGHISQRDLVLTQFAFYGFGLIRSKMFGMSQQNAEDVEGYLHFWRTIGYMMGIDDRFNLCRPSLEESKEITEAICKEGFCQMLYNPPEYFFFMTTELLKGMWYIIPLSTVKSFMYFTYAAVGVPGFTKFVVQNESKPKKVEWKTDIETNGLLREVKALKNGKLKTDKPVSAEDMFSRMNWYDKTFLWLCFATFGGAITNCIGRLYFNGQIKMIMFFVTYFPFLCFYRFGFRNSYVNMFVEDTPMDSKPRTNEEMLAPRVSEKAYGRIYNSSIATVKVAKNVN